MSDDRLDRLETRLDHHIEGLKGIKDTVEEIKITVSKQRWWQKWGIPAGVIALVVALVGAVTTVFLTSYSDWQNERSDLQTQVATLKGQASDANSMKDLVSQYNALIMYALQQNKLSEQEVSEFVKGIPGVSPAGPLRPVQITDPSERSQAPDGTIVRGVLKSTEIQGAKIVDDTCWQDGCSKRLSSSERTIWIVTVDTASNRFYPQGNWSDQAGPVLINSADEWVSPAVFMGATPTGTPIIINAVLVSHSGEDVFKAYLERGEVKDKNGKLKYGYPGLMRTQLPAGMDILDTVMVFKK